jgi:predicted GIY-YIG superfamily endonuclease
MVTWQFFKSDYRRWWSLSIKRNIRRFNYNYSLLALIKKLKKKKKFRPFCLCLPNVMFVTCGSKNSLSLVFDFLSNLDCGQWYQFWILLDCHVSGSQYVGESVQSFNKRINGHRSDLTKKTLHIRCFTIGIAKDLILLSCRLAMEHLWVLQLETALATLVATWFTLADRQWRSRYRCSDQCILNAFRSPERYNGWFRRSIRSNVVYLLECHVCGSQYVGESVQPFNKRMNGHRSDLMKLGQRFTFFNFFPMMTDNACNFL